jgi:hypothetical protein
MSANVLQTSHPVPITELTVIDLYGSMISPEGAFNFHRVLSQVTVLDLSFW